MGGRKCHLVTAPICRSRSSGQRVLPCVNATIIHESHCRLIDEEMNRREGRTETGDKSPNKITSSSRFRNLLCSRADRQRGWSVWPVTRPGAGGLGVQLTVKRCKIDTFCCDFRTPQV